MSLAVAVLSDKMKQENMFHMMEFFSFFFPSLKKCQPYSGSKNLERENTKSFSCSYIFKKSVASTFFFSFSFSFLFFVAIELM